MCSKKCGGGVSYRKRKCIPSKCPYADPAHNKCDGSDYEEKKCNEKCCPGMSIKHAVQCIICKISKQKNHTGEFGKIGLCVARSVVVEFLTERENVFHQNVHTLILDTTNVMEMITKRRNVTNSVAQVCFFSYIG